MPKPPLPRDVLDLLSKPNPAVIATLRPDGQPVSVATWYVLDGDRILVNMSENRRRLAYLRKAPPGVIDRARRGQLVHPRKPAGTRGRDA
jgi:hypothetical protein